MANSEKMSVGSVGSSPLYVSHNKYDVHSLQILVMILDQRPTKLSAVRPHTIEKAIKIDEVVPNPQSTTTARADTKHEAKIAIRTGTRSDSQPVAMLPSTDAAVGQHRQRHISYRS
jgi:hypothetical protein